MMGEVFTVIRFIHEFSRIGANGGVSHFVG
jgi:hypothetical protein